MNAGINNVANAPTVLVFIIVCPFTLIGILSLLRVRIRCYGLSGVRPMPKHIDCSESADTVARGNDSLKIVGYPTWLILLGIVLLGLGIRLAALQCGQAYSYFQQGDGVEAYQVAVDYGHGNSRAQYLGQ